MINDFHFCAVVNEQEYNNAVNNFGRENVKFGTIHRTFNTTMTEWIFSRAVTKYQDLMI